jgi:hypothetical protein
MVSEGDDKLVSPYVRGCRHEGKGARRFLKNRKVGSRLEINGNRKVFVVRICYLRQWIV